MYRSAQSPGPKGEGDGTMSENEPHQPQAEPQAGELARRFVGGLSEEEIMLLRLRDELYEGRWDSMLEDLNDRLQGKPYVFKLAHRIQDDIQRIERLSRFERQHGVNLAEYL